MKRLTREEVWWRAYLAALTGICARPIQGPSDQTHSLAVDEATLVARETVSRHGKNLPSDEDVKGVDRCVATKLQWRDK